MKIINNTYRGLVRIVLFVVAGIVITMSATGCALFRRAHNLEPAPQFVAAEPVPTIQRVDLNRTAREIGVEDRTAFTIDESIAKARLVIDKGSPADFRVVAKLLAPFTADVRRWHAEDQARCARYQILIGLAASDEACVTAGAGNLAAARPNIRDVVFEYEATLLYAAHARLGWQRPNIAPTRLSNAMLLFTSSSNIRRYVDDLRFVSARGGASADIAAIEKNTQEAAFDVLAAWVKSQPIKEPLGDLLQSISLNDYRNVRVALPTTTADPDIFASRLLVQIFRELGADI